jgi:hypothetical protein
VLACCVLCTASSSELANPLSRHPKPHRRFIGEWYEKEPPHHAPTEEQIALGSRNCFIVGGIYLGWVAFATACVCVMGRSRR